MNYYLTRVYDDDGKPLSTRCEKAKGPRQACKLAFGVIYDNDYNKVVYKNAGTRKTGIDKASRSSEGWQKIPKTGD
jgi:hypothetical protein